MSRNIFEVNTSSFSVTKAILESLILVIFKVNFSTMYNCGWNLKLSKLNSVLKMTVSDWESEWMTDHNHEILQIYKINCRWYHILTSSTGKGGHLAFSSDWVLYCNLSWSMVSISTEIALVSTDIDWRKGLKVLKNDYITINENVVHQVFLQKNCGKSIYLFRECFWCFLFVDI